MAQTSNIKSTQLTNRDASPQLLNDPAGSSLGSHLRAVIATLACLTADTTSSVYRFFSVPSNALIQSLKIWTDALSTSVTLNIGVYQTTLNGAAAVSATLFASALSASSAVVNSEQRFNALGINTASKQLWDLLGLSADPGIDYDICIAPAASITAGGNITLQCMFSV